MKIDGLFNVKYWKRDKIILINGYINIIRNEDK